MKTKLAEKVNVVKKAQDILNSRIAICNAILQTGLHRLWYPNPSIRDTSTWSKFGAHGEHADVFLFSNLGAL